MAPETIETADRPTLDTGPARMYEEYFVPAIFTPWTERILRRATPREGERALDLACGTGIVARRTAPLVGPRGHVIGVDVSPAMLAVAAALPRPEGAPVEWREADASDLPFRDGIFDLVLCQQGLQFVPDRAAAVREIRRSLRPGGRTVVAVWKGLDHQPVYHPMLEAEARLLDVPITDLAAPFSLGSRDTLRALFAAAGFRDIEIAEETGTVRFPSPDRFVELSTLAAAAVIPAFAELDAEHRAAHVRAVQAEVAPLLEGFTESDILAFPMTSDIVTAR